jgi:hypothetical protein
MARRLTVMRSDDVKWQVRGVRGGSGGDEVFDAEPFTGIGWYARAPADGTPESVMLSLGGTKHPALIAQRDEETRRKSASDLDEGEGAGFNAVVRIVFRKDGTIELGLVSGGVLQKALLAESFRSALTTLLGALSTYVTALTAFANTCVTAPPSVPATTLTTAAGAFATAMTSFTNAWSTYLSDVVKHQ